MPKIPWTPTTDAFDDMWDASTDDFHPFDGSSVPDMLETMFAQQLANMQAYAEQQGSFGLSNGDEALFLAPELWGCLQRFKTQAALRENASYVVEELYEAISLLKNKPWKQTATELDEGAFTEELADVWHFFIQFHILAGVNPLDVFQAYFRKSLINEHRRETGY